MVQSLLSMYVFEVSYVSGNKQWVEGRCVASARKLHKLVVCRNVQRLFQRVGIVLVRESHFANQIAIGSDRVMGIVRWRWQIRPHHDLWS